MKNILLVLFLLIVLQVQANMAEPMIYGTLFSRPFTNQFVDIVHEDILITLDSNFNNAQFEITYHLKASKDGVKIPLLFYAMDLETDLELDFKVFVDGKTVQLLEIPNEYKIPDSTKFNDFTYFFTEESYRKDEKQVLIQESDESGFYVGLNDLKYFEMDILKGEHTIKVVYAARKWTDSWSWVKEYSFRYALSPAQYWKSFGTLSIVLNTTQFKHPFTTNLGEPIERQVDSITKWHFDSLPTEILKIIYKPEISANAKMALKIGVGGFALFVGILLLVIHLISIVVFRFAYSTKKTSWVVIAGSIIIPFIFWYMLESDIFYSMIDNLIGEHASRMHYSFLGYIGFFYAFTMPIYWLMMWFVDWLLRKQIVRFKNSIRN